MLHVGYQLKASRYFQEKEGSQLRPFIYPAIHPPTHPIISSSSVDHLLPINQSKRVSRGFRISPFPSNHILSLYIVDSEKEFVMVDSYSNLSWLVWIQMFVFFLLLLLFCVFGLLSSSDISVSSADSLPSSSASRRFLSGDPIPISRHHGLGFSVVQSNQVNSPVCTSRFQCGVVLILIVVLASPVDLQIELR